MHFKARLVLLIPIQVVAWQQETTHESTPILLHCSDGFSRSGLMVAIAQMIWRANEEGRVSIYRVVRRLRICCPNAVAHYVSLTPNYSLQIQGNLSCARKYKFRKRGVSIYKTVTTRFKITFSSRWPQSNSGQGNEATYFFI